MKHFRVEIEAPGGTRAYRVVEAENAVELENVMRLALLLTRLVTGTQKGCIHSIVETAEPCTEGAIVTHWGEGQSEGRPIGYEIGVQP